MKREPVAKDGNKTCKCGEYIFVLGQEAWRARYDAFKRPVYICDKCKGK